jgi:endonuclease YncB( thermonuclease family)
LLRFMLVVGLVAGFLMCAGAAADTLSGRVVRVVDGDTLVLLVAGHEQERIRLAGIDCPERKQAFGTRAKQALTRRVAGKVIADGRDVDLALVREGRCWWYRKYAREQTRADRVLYENAEAKARKKRLGLWRDPAPVPPWEWRKEHQHGR